MILSPIHSNGMTLESEIPFVPKSAPAKLRPVFDGAYNEECSVQYFRDFLPDSYECEEISSKNQWPHKIFKSRTFWYSGSQPPVNSIQQKIGAFLLSLENTLATYLAVTPFIQFWAPTTTKDGKRTLSVSKQPFVTKKDWKGLCRYRYYCQELSRLDNGREVGSYFGPIGRAFSRGSVEFSPDVGNYSEKDFPLKNHAKHCGVNGYMAMPLFELGNSDADGQQLSCVGTLEFVSFNSFTLSNSDAAMCVEKLKEVGLAFRYPACSEALIHLECDKIWLEHSIRPYFSFPPPQNAREANPDELTDELSSSLDFVRKKHSLPLVQIWIPCICNGSTVSVECEPNSDSFSKVTHLVCGLQCLDMDDSESEWLSSYKYCDPLVYFIEDGDSWVGRAHALKKICFIKDIRQYSIMDYPFATSGNSLDLLACFAVPLLLVNPKLPPLVLEVFLPTQYNFDADRGAILKPIVSTFARELSKYNADFGLRKDEEYFAEISHSEDDYDCVYLDMYHGLPVVEEHQPHQPNDATEIEELQVPTRQNSRPYFLPCNDTTVSGRSTLKRKCPSFFETRPTHLRNDVLNAQRIPELPTVEEEAATVTIPLPANGKEKTFGPRNLEVIDGNGAIAMSENGKCGSKDAVDHQGKTQ